MRKNSSVQLAGVGLTQAHPNNIFVFTSHLLHWFQIMMELRVSGSNILNNSRRTRNARLVSYLIGHSSHFLYNLYGKSGGAEPLQLPIPSREAQYSLFAKHWGYEYLPYVRYLHVRTYKPCMFITHNDWEGWLLLWTVCCLLRLFMSNKGQSCWRQNNCKPCTKLKLAVC